MFFKFCRNLDCLKKLFIKLTTEAGGCLSTNASNLRSTKVGVPDNFVWSRLQLLLLTKSEILDFHFAALWLKPVCEKCFYPENSQLQGKYHCTLDSGCGSVGRAVASIARGLVQIQTLANF